MRIDIKTGGDGVECWNAAAVQAYVAGVDARESQLARDNPDLAVLAGQVTCYGCMVQDHDYGIRCSAEVTRTRFAVRAELEPRLADAATTQRDIPGLATIRPGSEGSTPAPRSGASSFPSAPVPAAASARRGLRGLLGR